MGSTPELQPGKLPAQGGAGAGETDKAPPFVFSRLSALRRFKRDSRDPANSAPKRPLEVPGPGQLGAALTIDTAPLLLHFCAQFLGLEGSVWERTGPTLQATPRPPYGEQTGTELRGVRRKSPRKTGSPKTPILAA